MVRRKQPLSIAETMTEDDKSTKSGGFFSNWFTAPSRTEPRDESDYSAPSGSSDSIDDQYPMSSRRERRHAAQIPESLDDRFTDIEFGRGDEDGLAEFDRDLRSRHAHGCKYMRNGKLSKALKKFEGILASILERFGDNHHRVGSALHNVGIANLRAGKLSDAMDAIEEAVRIRKLTLGPDDPKVADSLVELGIVLLSMKAYNDSLEIFMEALEMREGEAEDVVLPEEIKETNLKVAKVLNNIGCVNFESSKFDAAKEAFVDAIEMQKRTLGEASAFSFTNPATKPGYLTMASTMCNKGYIDLEQENYKSAIAVFNESLKIQKLLLGADNKLVLSTLNNLGFAYTMNETYDKALLIYRELLSSQEKSYAETQVDCGYTMRKIVFLELKLQDFETALKTICAFEDIQHDTKRDKKDIDTTKKLMGQVNYQVMKYPGCTMFACTSEEDADVAINLENWVPRKPVNGSKMSGHRVTCA